MTNWERALNTKTSSFPSVVAAKRAATSQLGYYQAMMAPQAVKLAAKPAKKAAAKATPGKNPKK
jgi:hypothetical protein